MAEDLHELAVALRYPLPQPLQTFAVGRRVRHGRSRPRARGPAVWPARLTAARTGRCTINPRIPSCMPSGLRPGKRKKNTDTAEPANRPHKNPRGGCSPPVKSRHHGGHELADNAVGCQQQLHQGESLVQCRDVGQRPHDEHEDPHQRALGTVGELSQGLHAVLHDDRGRTVQERGRPWTSTPTALRRRRVRQRAPAARSGGSGREE